MSLADVREYVEYFFTENGIKINSISPKYRTIDGVVLKRKKISVILGGYLVEPKYETVGRLPIVNWVVIPPGKYSIVSGLEKKSVFKAIQCCKKYSSIDLSENQLISVEYPTILALAGGTAKISCLETNEFKFNLCVIKIYGDMVSVICTHPSEIGVYGSDDGSVYTIFDTFIADKITENTIKPLKRYMAFAPKRGDKEGKDYVCCSTFVCINGKWEGVR